MSPRGVGISLERDEAVVEGRAKGPSITYYSIPGVVITQVTTHIITNGADRYAGWVARTPIVVDQLAIEVTAAGTNTRFGFYRADRDWQPIGAPLADSGSIDVTALGVKTYTPTDPILVRPGRYLSVNNADASVTLRAVRAANIAPVSSGLTASAYLTTGSVARAYGAFPTPGTAWDSETADANGGWRHQVFYRIVRP